MGVNTDEVILSQPDCGEDALNIIESVIKTKKVDLVVVDSVAALVPRAEIEGEMGDSHMGLMARLMSQALRKLTGLTARNKPTIIFVNQLRTKIGIVFGNPETTTGGLALKFYASVRIDLRKREVIKKKNEIIGNKVRIKIVKNKCASPFKVVEVNLIHGKGWRDKGEHYE